MFLSIKRNKQSTFSLRSFEEKFSHIQVEIDRNLPTDIQLQLDMIQLKERDLQILKLIQPAIKENIHKMTTGFYGRVMEVPHLTAMIQSHSTVNRLKQTLQSHLIEMFDGHINDVFVSKRERIAHAHIKIGLEPKWYMAAFNVLFEIAQNIIHQHFNHSEERAMAINAVNKILSFEQQLVLTAYEEREKQLREKVDRNAKLELVANVGENAARLAATAEQTHASTSEMSNQSKIIKEASNKGKQLSNEVQRKSQDGSENMKNLNRQIQEIKQGVSGIVENAKTLDNNAKEVQGIVNIILEIADQTNLLALNAAIEAARAGGAGKGFAVVAEEVRKLANQTKSSSSKVSEISGKTNHQIKTIEASIQNIDKIVQKCVKTTELVNQLLEQILKEAKESNNQNILIETEISGLVNMLSDVSEASEEVANTATLLSETISDYTGIKNE
ncbi:globin-coupled sensor protein [Niallia endozanthoxylica]|uniref:Globin-coupled sensor protein n=1 Tax=Niallia endozanthoxylica TaxID=2036016 RepID=A0A5J5HNG3_9BACI|nr:globin-coupled sensor protein [Niallia endozanthoxylica]KAA9022879.1 globin-coupled sensor protein [Niallia endozanthoxylica]